VQVSAPANGNAVLNGNAVTYTPAPNFAGTDTFTYTARDGFGQTDTATVRVTIIAPALAAMDDTADTLTGTPVIIPVLINDIGMELTIIQVGNPGHGSATISAGNTITYTSASEFTGVDAFTYTITDGIRIDSASVTVTVTRSKEDVQKLLEGTTDDPSAKTVGHTIGGLCFDGTASADFLRDCDTLVDAASADDPRVGSALEQITPKSLTTAVDASQTSVQSQMMGIRSRMASLRSGVMGINLDQLNIQRGGWTLSGRDLRYLLASVGEETGVPSADIGTDLGPFGIFASGAINLGDRDETQNQPGFDFKTLELILGADYRFSDQSILGIALSYNATDTDMNSYGGSLDSRGYGLTLYGVHYLSDQLYVEGMVNYGRNDYDQQRNVAYQLSTVDVEQRFDSSYGGQQFFAEVGAGYQFTHGNLTFGPEVRLSYLDLQVDSFQERALNSNPGSAWAVAMDEQNLQSLVSSLGGRASYLLNQSWGTLEPQLELSWLHEFKDNNRWVSGRFVEGAVVPDNIFQIFMDPVDENYFRFSLGLLARFNRGPSALIQYRTLFDYENLETHSITTQLRWEF
jgi:outer membrane autotransporter protein